MSKSTEYDVVIFGGGLCGLGAAAELSKDSNLKILIVEPKPTLAWEISWAYNLDFQDGAVDFANEIAVKLAAVGGKRDSRVDAPITEIILQQWAKEKRIDLLHYCQATAVTVDNNRINNVMLGGKSGLFPIQARYYIDATENAFLTRKCGVEVANPRSKRSKYKIFMNFEGQAPKLPEKITLSGNNPELSVKQSIWDGEVALEFEIDSSSVDDARLATVDILKALREECPEFATAVASHMPHSLYPLETWVASPSQGVEISNLENLFAAGPWLSSDSTCSETLNSVDRLGIGAKAGEKIAAIIKEKAISKPETLIQTQTEEITLDSPEVLVCGGGVTGVVAALAAGRQGAEVTLLEASTCLGGAATGGGIHSYCAGVPGGLQDEIDARVAELTPLFHPEGKIHGFHPEVKKIALKQMLNEAGVKCEYEVTICSASVDSALRRIRDVNTSSDAGEKAYRAKVVIDSTGDADVAAMAGCEYKYGRDTDSVSHAYSQPSGVLGAELRIAHLNFDAGHCDPTDVWDLSRARTEGVLQYLREAYTEEDRITYMAPLIGLRSSRFIVGEYVLTLNDEIEWRSFPDKISYMRSFFDDHEFDFENETDQALALVWVFGRWSEQIGCEVPYRCLLPRDVEGLLLACRALSMTNDAHYGFRMQRDLQRVGEAAGIAAALAVKNNVTPKKINVADLQDELRKSGSIDNPDLNWVPKEKTSYYKPKNNVLEEEFQCEVYQLVHSGEAGEPKLIEELDSDIKERRYMAALGLAVMGNQIACDTLIECVKDRCEHKPAGNKTAPLWIPAMSMLGILKSYRAAPIIEETLSDSDPDILMTAIRALGKIGASSSVNAIEKVLERKDLSLSRKMQGNAHLMRVYESLTWQFELLAAESLSALGSPRANLVEKYLNDPNASARRYAERVPRV